MKRTPAPRRMFALTATVMLCSTACGFQGVNSLPLPGTVGNGKSATNYTVELANISVPWNPIRR